MGNEMGNNNATGQQVSEERAKGFHKTNKHLDCSPELNNTNVDKNNEKDGTEDVGMSESLKGPIVSHGGDEQMASDQKNSSTKNEDLDEKKRGSLQDHTSIKDDDQNGEKPQKNKETGRTTHSTETIPTLGNVTEDMASNKDNSTSDEKFKQLVHEIRERSEESTTDIPRSLLEENIEGSLEDEEPCSDEVAVVGGNLVGEDTVENLEQGHTGVSKVDCQSMPMQGETASSTESIITDYLHAYNSEIKEVVIEDEPRERDDSSYVRPADSTYQEISKNDNNEIPEEKEEICGISKATTIEAVSESGEALEEDKKIHASENQDEDIPKCSAPGALDIGEVVSKFQSSLADPSATNDRELEKHEVDNSVAAAGQVTDSVSATTEHNVNERTDAEQEGIVDKVVAVQNIADNFEGEKKSDGVQDFVSLVEDNGEDFTGLCSSLSYHLPTVNEEKVLPEVNEEELATPTTATSSALQLVEMFVKEGDTKHDCLDSNQGTITSTYEAKTIDTREPMNSSQCDQPQQVLLEEPEVVKFENSEGLSTCMQSVEYSSTTGTIFPNGSNKERKGASATATCFTFESNQEKVTVTAGFTTESNQKKITANADNTTDERCLLQIPTPGRDAGEETPLLQRDKNISSLSYSTELHSKVVDDIPMTNIALTQAKGEGEEETEKSPLLSPMEPLEGELRAPNHSARNKKPLHSLMTEDRVGTWSPLNEQETVPKNSVMASSPISKGKQKPRSSLFASCMCCTTATN